ncbi:MAG: ABC transporter ATP-binding protein [Rhodothermales bacterium]
MSLSSLHRTPKANPLQVGRWIKRHRQPLLHSMALTVVMAALGVVLPLGMKLLIDAAYPARDLPLALSVVGLLFLARLIDHTAHYARGYLDHRVATQFIHRWRLDLLAHLLYLPLGVAERFRSGDLHARCTDFSTVVWWGVKSMRVAVLLTVYGGCLPFVLWALQPRLALLVGTSVPVLVLVTWLVSRRLRRHWQRALDAKADLDAYGMEIHRGLRTLKTMAAEPYVLERATHTAGRAEERSVAAGGLAWVLGGVNRGLSEVWTLLYLVVAWPLLMQQALSLGAFLAFQAYVALLHRPLWDALHLLAEAQKARAALARVQALVDEPTEQRIPLPCRARSRPPRPSRLLEAAKPLRIADLVVQHGSRRVVDAVSLTVRPGEVVALMGASGSGKSSLLHGLTRLHPSTSGTVWYGEACTTAWPLARLRGMLRLVPQTTHLFATSLRENLLLGRTPPSDRTLADLLRLTQLDMLVDSLPDGLDAVLTEDGHSLSGGERQRVALVRALLHPAPVLLLDEAVSAVDPPLATAILTAVAAQAHVHRRTVVFTTHRPALARLASRVVVLHEGCVVDDGDYGLLSRTSPDLQRLIMPSHSVPFTPTGDGAPVPVP